MILPYLLSFHSLLMLPLLNWSSYWPVLLQDLALQVLKPLRYRSWGLIFFLSELHTRATSNTEQSTHLHQNQYIHVCLAEFSHQMRFVPATPREPNVIHLVGVSNKIQRIDRVKYIGISRTSRSLFLVPITCCSADPASDFIFIMHYASYMGRWDGLHMCNVFCVKRLFSGQACLPLILWFLLLLFSSALFSPALDWQALCPYFHCSTQMIVLFSHMSHRLGGIVMKLVINRSISLSRHTTCHWTLRPLLALATLIYSDERVDNFGLWFQESIRSSI